MAEFVPGGPARYRHQIDALKLTIRTKGVTALVEDPGCGKSATVIDFASILALKLGREARVLVVCPLVAMDTWIQHCEAFTSPGVGFHAEALGGTLLQRAEALADRGGSPHTKPLTQHPRRRPGERRLHQRHSLAYGSRPSENGARFQLIAMNTDTFSSKLAVGSKTMADVMLDAVQRYSPDLMVVDESHLIKGWGSNTSRLMGRIGQHVPRRMILTGTLMPHSPLDVLGQWRFLNPTAFGQLRGGKRQNATLGGFKARYARMGGYMGREIVSWRNLDEMQDIMGQNAIVVRKEDALDLPPTTDVEVPVTLSPAEASAYLQMKKDLVAQLADGTDVAVANRLAQMMRLRQITSGLLPDGNGGVTEIGTSKADTIASLVHDTLAGEKRIVVFAMFRAEIELLRRKLATDPKTTVLVVTGDTPKEERIEIRKRFGSDDPERIVLVAQIKTMSMAVNELVTASHAIYGSLSQQRDDWIQSRDRLNRIGQTKPVTYWNVAAPGTIDQVIIQSHRDRTDLEESLLKHLRASVETVVQ